ncbi:hypothetical protein [Trinickia mobilis]|uniref:hypothetical protein n=1 Tax=Trinickia mobilis TaxID=2816356 RepID=UPI001A8E461C|nr:hypothetical protein [Trinickia mobilis]
MAIPIEVFSSPRGVFIAAPADSGLFDVQTLSLSRRSRQLQGHKADSAEPLNIAKLPVDAVDLLASVPEVPVGAFDLGGVCAAATLPLSLVD